VNRFWFELYVRRQLSKDSAVTYLSLQLLDKPSQ